MAEDGGDGDAIVANIDLSRLPLLLVAGGLAFGGVLAAATPTRMRDAPEPSWRIASAPRDGVTVSAAAETGDAPWFSAAMYEVLPVPHWRHGYDEAALPPPVGRFADRTAWEMDDADMPHGAVDSRNDNTILVLDDDAASDEQADEARGDEMAEPATPEDAAEDSANGPAPA